MASANEENNNVTNTPSPEGVFMYNANKYNLIKYFYDYIESSRLKRIGLTRDYELTPEARLLLSKRGINSSSVNKECVRSTLNIFYANLRSARKKLSNLNNQSQVVNSDMLVLTETWFSESKIYPLEDYEMLVSESRQNTTGGHSGGCAIYVKKHLKGVFSAVAKNITNKFTNVNDVQICAVSGLKKRIFCIYRSPNISEEDDLKFLWDLDKIRWTENDILLGDFNLPTIDWESKTARNRIHEHYMTYLMAKGFDQYVKSRTHKKNGVLDLCFANKMATTVNKCRVDESISLGSDHFAILITIKTGDDFVEKKRIAKFSTVIDAENTLEEDWKNYEREIEDRKDELSDLIDDNPNQTNSAIRLTAELMTVYSKYVKSKLICIPARGTISKERKRAENQLDKQRRKHKDKNHPKVLEASKALKHATEEEDKERKLQNLKNIMKDQKSAWDVLRGVNKRNDELGTFYKEDGTLTESSKESAKVLSDYYGSITVNVSEPPIEHQETPKDWQEDPLRLVVERIRGFAFPGRDKRTTHRLITRDYDFNTHPISFKYGPYPDYHFVAGELYDVIEYENYYGHPPINFDILEFQEWIDWIELQTAVDSETREVIPLKNARKDIIMKRCERRQRKLMPFRNIYYSEEHVVQPQDYPEWWYVSEEDRLKSKEQEYYKMTLHQENDINNNAVKRPIRAFRKKLKKRKVECKKPMKVKHLNRRERKRKDMLMEYLDFNTDILGTGDFATPRRPEQWGRPELRTRGIWKECLPPDWWQPVLPAPLTTSEAEVTELTLKLAIEDQNKDSAPGVESLFTNVIKKAGSGIHQPLMKLFNNCIKHGSFPEIWKYSWIKSLPKHGGDPHMAKNTRPISILPALSKLFETCLGRIEDYFLEYWNRHTKWSRILPRCQYGFRAKSSCADNLSNTLHKINHVLDAGFSIDVTLFDYAKAFDKTTFNQIIRDKMQNGLSPLIAVWKDYFKDRSFTVKIEDQLSEPQPVHGGCPQGAPRSPVHFTEYIRDMYVEDGNDWKVEENAFGPEEICISKRNLPPKQKFYEGINREGELEQFEKRYEYNMNNNKKFAKEMFKETFINKEGHEIETTESKTNRLSRHVQCNFYADDTKTVSIVAAPAKIVRRRNRFYKVPAITFGDNQSVINKFEEICQRKKLEFHPKKCQVLRLGLKNPNVEYKMKEQSTGKIITLEEAKVVRDLGLYYKRNEKTGMLSTEPTFDKLISKARGLSLAAKETLRGASLERHNLIYHGLIKSQFCFATENWYLNTPKQNEKLNKIYTDFFSDIKMPRKEEMVLPEPLPAFLKKLNVCRMRKILQGQTALEAEDYWQVTCPYRSRVEVPKLKDNKTTCWCQSITEDYLKINKTWTRIDKESLLEYLDGKYLADIFDLRTRAYVINGGRETMSIDYYRKIESIKERQKLETKKGKKDWKRINSLTKLINGKSLRNRIIDRVDRMNTPEILRLNKSIKKRTKTRKEFKAMVKAIRNEFLMKSVDTDFYD